MVGCFGFRFYGLGASNCGAGLREVCVCVCLFVIVCLGPSGLEALSLNSRF